MHSWSMYLYYHHHIHAVSRMTLFLKNDGNWNKKNYVNLYLFQSEMNGKFITNSITFRFYFLFLLFVSWNCTGMWNCFYPFDFFRIFSFCKKADLNCFVHHLFAFMMALKLMICNYLILTNHHQSTGLFRYVNLLIINFYVYLITRTLHNIYLCFFTIPNKYQ